MKTRLKALEELYGKMLDNFVDAEIQVAYMERQDPNTVIYPNREVMVGGAKMRKDWTASMVIKQNAEKMQEDSEILEIIGDKIKKELGKSQEKKQSVDFTAKPSTGATNKG